MLIVLMLFGALVGAAASENALFGALLGAIAAWLLVRVQRLETQLTALRERLDHETLAAPPRTPRAAAARPLAEPPAAAASASPPHADTSAPPPVEPSPAVEPPTPTPAFEPTPPPPAFEPAPSPAPAAAAPAAPATSDWSAPPPADDWGTRAGAALRRWFTEGNVPVKIGMLVLFVGVAALLRYAVDQGMLSLPIELRLAGIAAAAVAALGFGWRQRHARRVFALALEGGAIGVLLLTVFAAFAYWQLLPAGFAFALVLLLVAGSALLALLQDAMALAVLGSVGGFLAPVLISTGSGNHVALFSYYALLDLAVFAIAWRRPWRVLNLVGFGFTFAIGSLWGWRYYRPEHFSTTEPFLILFWLLYVAIAVLYALRQPALRRGLVDGTLVFGTPLIGFGLQTGLLDAEPMPLAWSALIAAAVYAGLGAALIRRAGLATLALSFAALAAGFATLAVPLALSAQATAGTWALEGAALVWLGLRQQHRLPVWSGVALQALAGGAWLLAWEQVDRAAIDALPFVNGRFFGGALLALAALFASWRLQLGERRRLAALGFVVGLGWWWLAGLREALDRAPSVPPLLAWLAGSVLLFAFVRQRLPWPRLGIGLLLMLLLGAGTAVAVSDGTLPPLHGAAAWAWPLYVGAALLGLRALLMPAQRGLWFGHVLLLATVALVLALELHARIGGWLPGEGWRLAATIAAPALLLWASWRRSAFAAWPLAERFADYRQRWFVPATLALALWWLVALGRAGDPTPLPFLPLVNPLELAQLVVALLLWRLWRAEADPDSARQLAVPAAAAGFVFVSVATLRAVHHLAGLPWSERLLGEMTAQTSLTVVWSICGVGAWIIGSRRGSRPTWLAGALLMAVVLGKLILIDRQHMGNIAGIVSFLAVGLLLTVVGYLAPSPPRRATVPEAGA